MTTSTNFNVSPWFDDYDELKNFHRILFKPRIPVQARELTQLQTILQNQIERFGGQIFKDGSVVYGCSPQVNPNFSFVRLVDLFNNNINRDIYDINSSCLLVGMTSNVRAVPIIIKEGRISQYPDTNRFYVKYLNTGFNNATAFTSNETVAIYTHAQNTMGPLDANNLIDTINTLTSNSTVSHVGSGYAITINEGMLYQKGFFQRVDKQTGLVRDFDQNTYNMVVGFETQEDIITSDLDESLLDNAAGFNNYQAPGADRLKLTPTLIAKDKTTLANNDTFFVVYEFSNVNGELVQVQNQPAYDEIGDVLAQRTYEESGDYIIKPFFVETVPGSNTTTFNYQVDPGIGYIHGKRIEFLNPKSIISTKGSTFKEATQQLITTNYGNYIYVNETLGSFDVDESVDLYDAPQLAITNRRWQTVPLGNKIGTAKVRSMIYENGIKGSNSCQYLLYIYNIQMNSGKSFSLSVKSFYANNNGIAVADSILINNQTVLHESNNNKLLFPLSKKAVKTLRSSNGTINRTQFVTRMSANATLQANGFIQVTLGAPPAGGIDSLNYSIGAVGDLLESDFHVILGSNTVTSTLTGTISTNTTSANITGTSTNFNTQFSNNEFIAITSGGTTDYRRIVTVNSATSLTLDAPLSVANTTAAYSKFFPGGYIVPLNNTLVGTRTINITSSTTFEINTGLAVAGNLTSSQNVIVQFKVARTQAVEKKKNIQNNLYVKLYANTISNGTYNLGLTDVFRIDGVWAGGSFAETNSNVTNYFTLNSGMSDDIYDHSKLILNPKYYSAFTNEQLLVRLDRFIPNTSGGIGYFSVDSYPVDDANTANTSAITTSMIPVYKSSQGKYDLRDSIDFRRFKIDTASAANTIAGATLNPATTQTFTAGNQYLPEPDSNFQTDLAFYLGRIDLINMNTNGGLTVIQGDPSETPRTPLADQDSMTVASAVIPPYPSLTSRELEIINRKDYAISTSIATNRTYTMRDIGTLDQRIQRLEYTVTLNMLEQQAKDIQVSDANGLNRFKNGIFADPLNSHIFGDTSNFEYSIAIDANKGLARPLFSNELIDLKLISNTSTVQQTGHILTLPYTNEKIISQPFATKYRNCTEDFWCWKGSVDLYPGFDMARDETMLPNLDASIDLTQPFNDFASTITQATGVTIFGTRYGDWRTTSSSVISSSTSSTSSTDSSGGTTTNIYQNSVTNTVQQKTTSTTLVNPVSKTIDLGKSLVDISVQPYMKAREIGFEIRGMRPNSRIYAYFDSKPVSQYCAAGLKTGTDITKDTSITRTSNWGTPMYTDQYGNLIGKFNVPSGFVRTGDRTLLFVDVDSLVLGANAELTKSSAIFSSSYISALSRNTTLTTTVPTFNTTNITNTTSFNTASSTLISSTYTPAAVAEQTVSTTTAAVVASTGAGEVIASSGNFGSESSGAAVFNSSGGDSSGGTDPIAQTYTISAAGTQSGTYVTNVTVYFKNKDPNLGLTLVLVPVVSGFPDASNIIAAKHLTSNEINISDDGSVGTTFSFLMPYHASNKQYAFIVMPDANSPNYQIWLAELGMTDLISGSQVFACPYSGAALKSSNASTWTTLPKEQVKFDITVANFTNTAAFAYFKNDADDYITFNSLALTNANNALQVGDEVYPIYANNMISNTSTKGRLEYFNLTNNKIKIDGSTGGFAANNKIGVFRFSSTGNTAQANSTNLIGTFNISAILNPPVHAVVPKIITTMPLNTSILTDIQLTSNTGVIDQTYNQVVLNNEKEYFDYERVIFSKSNEISLNIPLSSQLRATLMTTNKYVSPIIDLTNVSLMAIENIINNDSTNENTRYGNAKIRYLCKPITLATGMDAEDLQVYISAWRPVNTDYKVYCKLLNGEDYNSFETKEWSLMTNTSSEMYSSSLNTSDFKEYMFTLPIAPVTSTSAYKDMSNNGVCKYSDTTGAIYSGFKTFAIKIVMLSNQRCIPPILDNCFAICLQT